MREGLRDLGQLRMVSKGLAQASRQLDPIIRVDKIIFKGILIVVLVWVRGCYSAGHHGHVVWWKRGVSGISRRYWTA
jgi:hypothetical protein